MGVKGWSVSSFAAVMLAMAFWTILTDSTHESVELGRASQHSDRSVAAPSSPRPAKAAVSPVQRLEADPELSESKDAVAALINLNGLLCAEPINVVPLKVRSTAFEVTCIKYRGGTKTAQYIVDGSSGSAWPA